MTIDTAKKRRIAYVTGTRADFGLMTPVLRAIQASDRFDLQVYATGMHLMPEFGLTVKDVVQTFSTKRIEVTIMGDNREGMASNLGNLIQKVTETFTMDRPDLVLVLGDRVEMLAVASACLYLGIPTAHLHGGDRSGTVDEVVRHAITKLAYLHFPATEEAAERIRKMGEESERIHVVGAPALDAILNEALPSREDVLRRLGLDPSQPFILLTQHSLSEEWQNARRNIRETLEAVKATGMQVIITSPNADAGGQEMIEEIKTELANPRIHFVPSLSFQDFLAVEREAAVWVGNSSAGMIESASFKTPVVNVGSRQNGRLRGANVIDAGYDRKEIASAIERALRDPDFRATLAAVTNPWGDGKTGPRVARILEQLEITDAFLVKRLTY